MKFVFLYWTPYTPTTQSTGSLRRRWSWPKRHETRASTHSPPTTATCKGPSEVYNPCLCCLAWLPRETGDLNLVTGIFLLAPHNPVEVAEQVATLDVISAVAGWPLALA